MADLKTCLLALAVSTMTGALLAACASGSEAPAGIYGNPPAVEDYLDSLGELQPLLEETSGVFPEASGPTSEEYRGLVAKYRADGLDGLSAVEGETLLLVAQIAFLAHADTLRYSVVTDDRSGSDSPAGGVVTLEEVYRHRGLPTVAARRMSGGGFSWLWADLPRQDVEGPDERLEVIEFNPADSERLDYRRWDREGDIWTCRTFTGADEWGMANLAHIGRFASYARGDLDGPDTPQGRRAYRFTIQGVSAWEDQTYWLDAETLWLRQFEFEEDGIHYTVKLEAVNEDITIEPPDVDVGCVEEQPE